MISILMGITNEKSKNDHQVGCDVRRSPYPSSIGVSFSHQPLPIKPYSILKQVSKMFLSIIWV